MTTDLTVRNEELLEKVILQGDLAELSPTDRVKYYGKVCESLGLNPYTRPFDYIRLNNKLVLYARRDATDQLRAIKNVSIEIPSRETIDGVYIVTAKAKMGDRTDESTGAIDISKLSGEFKANAMMKAETKAKRRVTLSIVGLGWLDETEISDINRKDVQDVNVDKETGEIRHTDAPQSNSSSPIEQEGNKIPLTIKELMQYAAKHGKSCTPSWVEKLLGVKDTSEIKDITAAYHTLRELNGWTD